MKSYGSPHVVSIHFCFQRLHLWVTASSQDLVYRELIRKYFGTEILQGAEVDNGCRFLDRKLGIYKQWFRACVCLNVRVCSLRFDHPGGSDITLRLERI